MVITIRRAVREDMTHIREMIQELADFERMPEGPKITVDDLIRDGGFAATNNGQPPLFFAFIVEEGENEDVDTSNSAGVLRRPLIPIGYALCFHTYSMWNGKLLFLEDIYVRPSHRKSGIGRRLFGEVLKYTRESGCKSMAFHVLAWNPARKFYESFNAVNWTEAGGQHFYRLDRAAMDKLLAE